MISFKTVIVIDIIHMLPYLKRMFKLVLIIVLVLLFARSFVIEPGRVNGRSMETTFLDEHMFLVNKFALLFSPPQRGDIVQFRGHDTGEVVIKRVIGLPGETISIYHNQIHIKDTDGNEFVLDEDYLDEWVVTKTASGKKEIWTMPDYNYFMLGDNRPYSIDSRNYGPVQRPDIYGLVIDIPLLNK